MPAKLDIRSAESTAIAEIYISATPTAKAPLEQQATEVFSGICDMLRSKRAFILHERILATQAAVETIRHLRSKIYGDLDDGVAPSFLIGREGATGPIAGVQLHAVICENAPDVLNWQGAKSGRIIQVPGRKYLALLGISAPQLTFATEQAQAILEKAESILKKLDADMLSVPRTWMWLGDILSWYDDFNHIRNTFFAERGVIKKDGTHSMPASTGIGLAPAEGGKCSMDLIAVLEPKNSIQYLQSTEKQGTAFEYGSAFSRACRAVTPAGQTVFISGTASIDADGATTNIDDPMGQINTTIDNVHTALKDMNCRNKDVVQVVAYCKTTDVEKIFNDIRHKFDWPWVTVICDICRPDLLFEIEATAMPGKPAK